MHHAKSRNTRGIDIESGLNLCKFVKFFEYISQLLKQQADKDLKPALTPLIGFVHRALLGSVFGIGQDLAAVPLPKWNLRILNTVWRCMEHHRHSKMLSSNQALRF